MKTFAVATAVNDAYVFPLAVMMRSVAASLKPGVRIKFHILTAGLLSSSLARLQRCLEDVSVDYEEVIVDASLLQGLKVDGHVSIETYFRLLLPHYLPNVAKALYLDADLIACHSIDEILTLDTEGTHLMAVPHASPRSGFFGSERGVPSFRLLGVPEGTRTFNAGVLLMNLEAWRRSEATGRVLRYLRDFREHVLWHDQDGLNAVLHDDWRPLEARWNVMSSHFAQFHRWQDSLLDEATFESVRRDPGIVHFTDLSKPWHLGYSGPFAEHWREAAEPISRR